MLCNLFEFPPVAWLISLWTLLLLRLPFPLFLSRSMILFCCFVSFFFSVDSFAVVHFYSRNHLTDRHLHIRYGYCIISTLWAPYVLRTVYLYRSILQPGRTIYSCFELSHIWSKSDITDSWENFESRTSDIFNGCYTLDYSLFWYLPFIIGHGKTPTTFDITFGSLFLCSPVICLCDLCHTERL